MHSSELPVTEWWDPADDVYDVPPCPQGDGRTDANLWTEAFLFSATIGWIWADYDGYWGRWTRQLTTGCTCRDVPRWYPGRPADPGCPTHSHQPPPVPPCSCHYGLHTTSLPYQQSATRVRRRTVVHGSYFAIDRDCLHHGDAALIYPLHSPVDPAFWDLLDEHERRGH